MMASRSFALYAEVVLNLKRFLLEPGPCIHLWRAAEGTMKAASLLALSMVPR